MEKLVRSCVILGVLFCACAAYLFAMPRMKKSIVDEKWMEKRAPDVAAGMKYFASAENPEQSYKVGEVNYKVLKPYGIVGRRYEQLGIGYDVMLIASGNYESFHDPRVCFTSQGWNIVADQEATVVSKTRGTFKVTLVNMENQGQKSVAVYFYKGPKAFHAKTSPLKLEMFKAALAGQQDVDGVFYRIMPVDPLIPAEELLKFVAEYLDASKESSQGYF